MDKTYIDWIETLKLKIRAAQLKASVAVNVEMILLYWEIGRSIIQKQDSLEWGSKVVEQMAKDLQRELPDTNGFSRTNLFAMRRFYLFYSGNEIVHQAGEQLENRDFTPAFPAKVIYTEIVHQVGELLSRESLLGKIPWRHHIAIMSKCTNVAEAQFYIKKTIENNWSRNILEIQLNSNLIDRQGKAQNNFNLTLPKPLSDLAYETLKDPYKFDFLTLETDVQELELEKNLTENITKFLLELGKGFAFVGRQYTLQIGNKERKLDLLFYHIKMHCYVVIDLKMGEFEPEYAGKMNYYLSAIDKLLKTDQDNPSIGIILCKSKDNLEVEYALQDMKKPMGISEFTFSELPKTIQNSLPSIEELEAELNRIL